MKSLSKVNKIMRLKISPSEKATVVVDDALRLASLKKMLPQTVIVLDA